MLDVWLGSEYTSIPTVKFSCDYEEYVKPLNAGAVLIQKPVDWFTKQVNWLVSIWEQHWHLMG